MINQFAETVYFFGATSFSDGLTFSPLSGNFSQFEAEKRVWVYPPTTIFDGQKNLIGFYDPSISGGQTTSSKEYARGAYSSAVFIPNQVTGHMNCGGIFLKGNSSSLVNGCFLMNESWAEGSTTFQPIQITGVQNVNLSLDERDVDKDYVPYAQVETSSSKISINNPICFLNTATETNPAVPDKIYRFPVKNKDLEWSSSNIFVKMFFSTDFKDLDQKLTSFDVIITPTNIGDLTFSESFTLNSSLSQNSKGTTGFFTVNDYNTIKASSSRSNYFSFGVKVNGAQGCSLNGLLFKNDGKSPTVYSEDKFNLLFGELTESEIEIGLQIQQENLNSLYDIPNNLDQSQ